jgi:hypothetical protein
VPLSGQDEWIVSGGSPSSSMSMCFLRTSGAGLTMVACPLEAEVPDGYSPAIRRSRVGCHAPSRDCQAPRRHQELSGPSRHDIISASQALQLPKQRCGLASKEAGRNDGW